MAEATPLYKHDCANCKYLATLNNMDLYVCARQNKIDTLIARYSSEPSDYSSGLEFAKGYEQGSFRHSENIKALYIALVLARIDGYKEE